MTKIFAFIFLIAGFTTVFAARFIVQKRNLDEKMKCEYEDELSDDEIKEYKKGRAILNVKMMGMLIALPGIVLVAIAFK